MSEPQARRTATMARKKAAKANETGSAPIAPAPPVPATIVPNLHQQLQVGHPPHAPAAASFIPPPQVPSYAPPPPANNRAFDPVADAKAAHHHSSIHQSHPASIETPVPIPPLGPGFGAVPVRMAGSSGDGIAPHSSPPRGRPGPNKQRSKKGKEPVHSHWY